MSISTVAIVQHAPAVLNLTDSLERAVIHITEAANQGAEVVVFPETWLTCYPAWAFGLAGWDSYEARSWYARLIRESPVLEDTEYCRDAIFPLRDAAISNNVTVVMGLNERSSTGGTIYNSLATIGSRGEISNLHRKVMPTHTERTIWGAGDAAGLRSVATAAGKVGGLICWEHFMPLARHTMHFSGEHIHVAAWPDFTEMHQIAARGYAFEGRCFVLCAASYVTTDDIPNELLDAYRAGVGPDAPSNGTLFNGGSAVIGPDGSWMVNPVYDRPEIIISELDMAAIDASHQTLDVVGHYSRDDLFTLDVNAQRRPSVNVIR